MFWVVVILVSATVFGYQTFLLVSRYIKFEVIVNTALKSEDRVFPAVTICNINPFKSSAINLETAPEMWEVMRTYRRMLVGDKTSNLSDPGNKFGFHRYNVTFRSPNGTIETNTTAIVGLQRRAREHLLLIGAEYARNDVERMRAVTYRVDEIVESCRYGPLTADPYSCLSHRDFTETYDASNGLCYTFNDKGTPRNSSFAGPRFGLRLIIRSEQTEYLELTEAAGARMALHVQGEEPFVDAFGYNAAAGFSTTFSIKYIHTQRLDEPYGRCSAEGGTGPRYYKGNYSVEGCLRSCIQDEIIRRCKCADPRYAPPKNAKICDYKDVQCLAQFSVGEDAAEVEYSPNKECDCPQKCSTAKYGVTVGQSVWPSRSFQAPNVSHFGNANSTMPRCLVANEGVYVKNASAAPGWIPAQNRAHMEPCQDWYRENTMNLEIYWERLNYEMLVEHPSYAFVSFLSDFGGQAGLWLGTSVITFVEVFTLLIILTIYCCKRNEMEKEEHDPYESEDEQEDPDYVPPPHF